MEGPLVTGNFFHVLGVSAARGRTLTPSDDEPGGRPAIVLSHRAWSRHFASDPGVLSRTVLVNGAPFHVVGVMPEGFRGLDGRCAGLLGAALAPWPVPPRAAGREGSVGLDIVGRLKPGVSRGQALAQLLVWDSRRAAERSVERPAASLVLEPRQGTVPLSADVMLLFMPLFFAFGLILMIGCANVANLLLARAVARQREIGIRLAIGASRRRVIWQLLTESLLLALVSAALAFGISRLVLEAVVYAVTSTFPPDIGNIRLAVPPADWRVALFLVAGAMVSTLFFALAPALQATRLELVRAIRGEVVRDARPGRARNALVALQVTGSVLLLICAAVFLRSSWAAATVDPGIRTADIVNVSDPERAEARGHPRRGEERAVGRLGCGVVAGVAGRARRPPALAEGASGKSTVTYQFVSPEYFGVLGIDLVRGRGFTQTERSASAAVAVVSESVARQLWPGIDAVGQVLRLEPDPTSGTREPDDPPLLSRTVVVVGIARDVAGFRLGGMRMGGAGVYMPIGAEAARTSLTMRVRGDAERARHALVDRLAAIDPNMGEVSTLQTIARTEAYLLGIPFWLTLVLGALALLLTLSGLFSVLSYLVEQRTQGDRRADGAWRDQPKHRRARAVTVGSSRRHRAAPRRQPHGRARRRAPGDACGRADRVDRASLRSGRLRRKPALHRHGVRMCGADSCAARRTDRSGRRAQAKLIRRSSKTPPIGTRARGHGHADDDCGCNPLNARVAHQPHGRHRGEHDIRGHRNPAHRRQTARPHAAHDASVECRRELRRLSGQHVRQQLVHQFVIVHRNLARQALRGAAVWHGGGRTSRYSPAHRA